MAPIFGPLTKLPFDLPSLTDWFDLPIPKIIPLQARAGSGIPGGTLTIGSTQIPISATHFSAGVLEWMGHSLELPLQWQLAALAAGSLVKGRLASSPAGLAAIIGAQLAFGAYIHRHEILGSLVSGKTAYTFETVGGAFLKHAAQLFIVHGAGLVGRGVEARVGTIMASRSSIFLDAIKAGGKSSVVNRIGYYLFNKVGGEYILPSVIGGIPMHLLHGLYYGFFENDWSQLNTVEGNITGVTAGVGLMIGQKIGLQGFKGIHGRALKYAPNVWKRGVLNETSRIPEHVSYQMTKDLTYEPFNAFGKTFNWVGGTGMALGLLKSFDKSFEVVGFEETSWARGILGVRGRSWDEYYQEEFRNLALMHLSARPFDAAYQWGTGQLVPGSGRWIDRLNTINARNQATFRANHYDYQHYVHNRVANHLEGEPLFVDVPDDSTGQRILKELRGELKVAEKKRDTETGRRWYVDVQARLRRFEADPGRVSLVNRVESQLRGYSQRWGRWAPATMEIPAYALGSQKIPTERIQTLVNQHLTNGKKFTLVVKGDPLDPPDIYVFQNGKRVNESLEVIRGEAQVFWTKNEKSIQRELGRAKHVELRLLRDAMIRVHGEDGRQLSLGEATNQVIHEYNLFVDSYQNGTTNGHAPRKFYVDGQDNEKNLFKGSHGEESRLLKRSAVLVMMDDLQSLMVETMVRTRSGGTLQSLIPGRRESQFQSEYAYFSEVAEWRKKFPPASDAPKILVFGAGEVSTLPLGGITYAKDLGRVDLDARVIAVSPRNFWVADQLNRFGHRFDKFGKFDPFLPAGSLKPYVVYQDQVAELIRGIKFDYAVLAAEHEHLVSSVWNVPEIVQAIKENQPRVFVNVSKDLSEDGNGVRATRLIMGKKGIQIGEGEDSSELFVVGGFYTAPIIAKGTNRLDPNIERSPLAFAGASWERMVGFARMLGLVSPTRHTPQSGEPNEYENRILNVEIVYDADPAVRVAQAERVADAGIVKNILGQYLSRLLTEAMLRINPADFGRRHEALKALHARMQRELRWASEEVGFMFARINANGGDDIDYTAFKLPEAVNQDIRRVMPESIDPLVNLFTEVHQIIGLGKPQEVATAIGGIFTNMDKGSYGYVGTRNGRGAIKRGIASFVLEQLRIQGRGLGDFNPTEILRGMFGVRDGENLADTMYAQEAGRVSAPYFSQVQAGERNLGTPLLIRLAVASYGGDHPELSVTSPLDPRYLGRLVANDDLSLELQAGYSKAHGDWGEAGFAGLIGTDVYADIAPLYRPFSSVLLSRRQTRSETAATWEKITRSVRTNLRTALGKLEDHGQALSESTKADLVRDVREFVGVLSSFAEMRGTHPVVQEVNRRLSFMRQSARQLDGNNFDSMGVPQLRRIASRLRSIGELFTGSGEGRVDVFNETVTPIQILTVIPQVNRELQNIF